MKHIHRLLALLKGDPRADRAVPRSGFTAQLTVLTAAAMAFLAVFALALALATGRLADRWAHELAQSSTVRISAPQGQMEGQTAAALRVLQSTAGIESARALDAAEQRALLEPWFGPDLPVETLPIPQLIEVIEARGGYDAEGLRLRLRAEAPGAVLDDHTRWRRPLIEAAGRLNLLAGFSILLIIAVMAAMVTLAANAALSANAQVIRVLRLVGARDSYIARAFVRRFTLRALSGAAAGTALGMTGIALLPRAEAAGGFLTGLGFSGAGWILPLLIPPLTAIIAFWSTRVASLRALKGNT